MPGGRTGSRGKPQSTRLRINSCLPVFQGSYASGHSYTLHEVEASKPDGTPIDLPLRSFEELPVGEVIDLSVVRYDDPDGTTSYTLAQKESGSKARLEQRIEQLEAQLARVLVALGMEEHAAS